MKKFIIACSLFSIITLISCDDTIVNETAGETVTINGENGFWGGESFISGDSYSGSRFCRIDSNAQYGVGYAYFLPDSFYGAEVHVTIQSMVRSTDMNTKGSIAIALHVGDTMLKWNEVMAAGSLPGPSKWGFIQSEIVFPAELITKPDLHVRIFGFKSSGKDLFDIDDLKIKISSKRKELN
jgi:hypothetical protein